MLEFLCSHACVMDFSHLLVFFPPFYAFNSIKLMFIDHLLETKEVTVLWKEHIKGHSHCQKCNETQGTRKPMEPTALAGGMDKDLRGRKTEQRF